MKSTVLKHLITFFCFIILFQNLEVFVSAYFDPLNRLNVQVLGTNIFTFRKQELDVIIHDKKWYYFSLNNKFLWSKIKLTLKTKRKRFNRLLFNSNPSFLSHTSRQVRSWRSQRWYVGTRTHTCWRVASLLREMNKKR